MDSNWLAVAMAIEISIAVTGSVAAALAVTESVDVAWTVDVRHKLHSFGHAPLHLTGVRLI